MNILEGKAKEDFKKWLKNNDQISWWLYVLIILNLIPFSMIYGLYTDFFDSKEVYIFSQPGIYQGEEGGRCYYNNIAGQKLSMRAWIHRIMSREEGIEIANRIYNNR